MAVRLSDSDGDRGFYKVDGRNKESELVGAFTRKSLKRMLSRLGESTSIDNCKAMIRRFDLNGDGVLSYDEFKVMMTT
ncbi:putative calcium-binding protein CML31 [Capsicum annuum]|uniref:Calcium-binding protein CML31 n=1 Tax=Capsicum annuum TaxID=4072 RepID=A0A2G2YGZ3_CAPAN|nr:putative calcium-binding protein CML31 [Capsicum annuum]KAF3632120.1 putative calcium-binding protein CML31 [Capsicum annuum]PHT68979.1 putative calcium-binding protein CML31 [Capsicum annuum]